MTPQIGSIMKVLGRLLHENIESGIISADEVTLSTATISERKVLFYLDKVDWQKIGVEQIQTFKKLQPFQEIWNEIEKEWAFELNFMFKHEIHENHFMETLPRIKDIQRRLKQVPEDLDMDRLRDGQERRSIAKHKTKCWQKLSFLTFASCIWLF